MLTTINGETCHDHKPSDDQRELRQALIVQRGRFDDLITHAETYGDLRKGSHTNTREFSGTKSFREAMDLARGGWHEGTERLSNLRDSIIDELGGFAEQPAPFMDVSGDMVDVGAYVTGAPENMVSWYDDIGTTRHAHVLVNVTASANKSTEMMTMRGLLAASIVDTLESYNIRVTLDVMFRTKYVNSFAWIGRLKEGSEVLDLERVAFCLRTPEHVATDRLRRNGEHRTRWQCWSWHRCRVRLASRQCPGTLPGLRG